MTARRMRLSQRLSQVLLLAVVLLLVLQDHHHQQPRMIRFVQANPASNPYIAYRTSPMEQDNYMDHVLQLTQDPTTSTIHTFHSQDTLCYIDFALGISKRVHGDWMSPIVAPPIVYPAFPGHGPGKQVLLTQYEHFDLLSPTSSISLLPQSSSSSSAISSGTSTKTKTKRSLIHAHKKDSTKTKRSGGDASSAAIAAAAAANNIKEMLLQATDFPLLLEGSMFWTSPLLVDVNGDGRPEAILTDSEGGIYIVGLSTTTNPNNNNNMNDPTNQHKKAKRYFSKVQTPRLFVRREWLERRVQHETKQQVGREHVETPGTMDDPYHTYFEYYSSVESGQPPLLQGISANWWKQESEQRQQLQQRRRQHHQDRQRKKTKKQEDTSGVVDHEGTAHDAVSTAQMESPEEKKDEHLQPPREGIKEHGEGMEQQQPQQPPVIDDFVGDDLEYMLAKQRDAEQRGESYDDIALDLRPGVIQRRRLQEVTEGEEHHHRDILPHEGDEPKEIHGRKEEEILKHSHEEEQRVAQEEPRISEHVPEREERVHEVVPGEMEGSKQEQLEGQQGEKLLSADSESAAAENVGRRKAEEETGLYGDDVPVPRNDIPDVDVQRAADDIANDVPRDDPEYGMKYDDYYRRGYGGADDEYRGRNERHREYYDSKHYIRIPPHILCTPVLAELPKLYSNNDEKEDILFVAVSYFLDEDEYEGLTGYQRFTEKDHGDETEANRGMYVASAIMAYILGDSPRWTGQTHLDMSTDYTAPENLTIVGALPIRSDTTRMGAFALGSPTVADVDGDGNLEVLLGTSMGIVYAFDARQMYKKAKFPIQMPHPVESRIVVEDVRGDTNLEIVVADTGGNVICFSHEANPLWHRNLATSVGLSSDSIKGSSPMALGDVNGDGVMDLVVVILIDQRSFVFAMNAATGEDLPNFPIELDPSHYPAIGTENLHKRLAQPLLVDLHSDQSFLKDYIRRNGTTWTIPHKAKSSPPGQRPGLHIVYPQNQYLHVIEAGSGCGQVIPIGDPISAMVQVDDVHGTNRLDLIVATEAGDVITLESPSLYHPLNTWTQGELRGRMNGHAHGYSSSQGIFVHEVSRQYIDVFGVYVPITFELFDNRPNIINEPEKRQYTVEIRDGASSKRVLFRAKYEQTGVYTERVYVRFGPGFYTLHVMLLTSHGLLYEDVFHIGYNVKFMNGFGVLLWLPLLVASATILFCGAKKSNWDEDDPDNDRDGHTLGILGGNLPS